METASGGKRCIVVVEDDHYVLDFLKFALQQKGYAVHGASDGQQALEVINQVNPSLVVLDLMLPKMDGFTVLKKLGDSPATAGIPVCVVSAYTTSEPTRRMVQSQKNVREIFTKPVRTQEFVARVGELVG